MSLIKRLKFFTGDQTWAVGGQMATKEKNKLGGLTLKYLTCHIFASSSEWIVASFGKAHKQKLQTPYHCYMYIT